MEGDQNDEREAEAKGNQYYGFVEENSLEIGNEEDSAGEHGKFEKDVSDANEEQACVLVKLRSAGELSNGIRGTTYYACALLADKGPRVRQVAL